MTRSALLALLLGSLAIACSYTTLDDVSCPDAGTPLTYRNFGSAFLASWCDGCHSAPLDFRQGAPESVVFDTPEHVRQWQDRIFERAAADNDSMPPGPAGPARAERDRLAEWLACGAP